MEGAGSVSQVVCIPDAKDAMADLDELASSLGLESYEFIRLIGSLLERGAPFFRAEVDFLSTVTAGRCVVRYQLAEELRSALSAVRARNVEMGEVEGCISHN